MIKLLYCCGFIWVFSEDFFVERIWNCIIYHFNCAYQLAFISGSFWTYFYIYVRYHRCTFRLFFDDTIVYMSHFFYLFLSILESFFVILLSFCWQNNPTLMVFFGSMMCFWSILYRGCFPLGPYLPKTVLNLPQNHPIATTKKH